MKTTLRLTIAAIGLAMFTVSLHAEDYTYTTNNGTITITGYTGPAGDVSIPGTINGLPVTSIGDNAFNSCPSMTSVTIPDSMISIGSYAFADCTSLTNIAMGNGVKTFGIGVFSGCTVLTRITIPDTLTNIGESPFRYCSSVTAIIARPENSTYSSLDGVLFNKNQTTLVAFPPGRTGAYALPNTVTTIGEQAFASVSLTNVIIPQSVSYIGYLALYSYNLTAAYFLGDCPSLHGAAFACADNLILYYRPGTAGWSSPIFEARRVLPWFLPNPVILDFGPSFGVVTNQFGFLISWATNGSVVVEVSTSLANPAWSPVSTNTLTNGWCHFSDAEWMKYPGRFYRLRSL